MHPACDAEDYGPTWEEKRDKELYLNMFWKKEKEKKQEQHALASIIGQKLEQQIMNTTTRTTVEAPKTLLTPERTWLAGVSYSDYQKLKTIKIGTELGLVWEKSNPEDKMAIAVYYKDVRIGYIPRVKSNSGYKDDVGIKARMHNLFACGFKVRAFLTAYHPQAGKIWEIFTIEVKFSDPKKVAKTNGEQVDIKF